MRMMPHAVPMRIVHVGRPCGAEMSEISQSLRTTIAKVLSKVGGRHLIFSGNEARLHLLADIITLHRQKEAVLVRG